MILVLELDGRPVKQEYIENLIAIFLLHLWLVEPKSVKLIDEDVNFFMTWNDKDVWAILKQMRSNTMIISSTSNHDMMLHLKINHSQHKWMIDKMHILDSTLQTHNILLITKDT